MLDTTLRAVAVELGWAGDLLPRVEILGERAAAVVRVPSEPSEWSNRLGSVPVCDGIELAWLLTQHADLATWQQPTQLVGFLVGRRSWRGARSAAAGLASFGPTVAILPADQVAPDRVQCEADLAGVGLAAVEMSGEISVLVGSSPRPDRPRTLTDVLVDQQLHRAVRAAWAARGAA